MAARPIRRKKTPRSPEVPIVIGRREQLFHLLSEAAEIEHTLMCSYLYAAFSLKRGRGTNLSLGEARLAADWRRTLMEVATEEMVHLVMVCNLSIALGGRPHFGRPNFPVAAGYFPSGVVVKLAPFSEETLDHFIFLERPSDTTLLDGAGFKRPKAYQRKEAFLGLMPSVQDYQTVGHLYEALADNLRSSAQRLGETALFVGSAIGQVGQTSLRLPGVHEIVNLKSALAAIDSIVEQGEGSAKHHDRSHFQRFRQIQAQYAKACSDNKKFRPAWPVATSPVMRKPVVSKDRVYVDQPDAAKVLDFANALYCQLMRCLAQAFGRTGPGCEAVRATFLGVAIDLMHLFGQTASHLATMRASKKKGVNAGVSFTMLRSVEPLFGGQAERQIFDERFAELADGVAVLSKYRTFRTMRRTLTGLRRKIRALN